jgi:hypothetical protein
MILYILYIYIYEGFTTSFQNLTVQNLTDVGLVIYTALQSCAEHARICVRKKLKALALGEHFLYNKTSLLST